MKEAAQPERQMPAQAQTQGGYSSNPTELLQKNGPIGNPFQQLATKPFKSSVIQGVFETDKPREQMGIENIAYTKKYISNGLRNYVTILGGLPLDKDITYTIETHTRSANHPEGLFGKTRAVDLSNISTIIYQHDEATDEATFIHEMLLHAKPIYDRLKQVKSGVPYKGTTNEQDHEQLGNWGQMLVAGSKMDLKQNDRFGLFIKIIADMSAHLNQEQYVEILKLGNVQAQFAKNEAAKMHAEARVGNFKAKSAGDGKRAEAPPTAAMGTAAGGSGAAAPSGAAAAAAKPTVAAAPVKLTAAADSGAAAAAKPTVVVAPAKPTAAAGSGAAAAAAKPQASAADLLYAQFAAEMGDLGEDAQED